MSAARLKTVMRTEGKRQIDLASDMNISPNSVGKYLRGEPVSRKIQMAVDAYLEAKSRPLKDNRAAS
jgi:transcriptional regulator with XRE-family HTH domain